MIDTVLIPGTNASNDKSTKRSKTTGDLTNTRRAQADNEFQPILEADLPNGFPAPGPVGEVMVKSYPSYRAAVADYRDGFFGRSSPFMDLFRHIKKNEIAMTAPVEQVVDTDGQSMKSMAFLYGNPELGSTGGGDRVMVQDMNPMTVVSLGIRGRTSEQTVADAIEQLNEWVRQHGGYRVAGAARVLGYNSPFVAVRNRYSEVQLPVNSVHVGI